MYNYMEIYKFLEDKLLDQTLHVFKALILIAKLPFIMVVLPPVIYYFAHFSSSLLMVGIMRALFVKFRKLKSLASDKCMLFAPYF